jgi:hypothetical protein
VQLSTLLVREWCYTVAVQRLTVAPARQVALDDPLFHAINLRGFRDGWVRDVLIDDTTEEIDAAPDTSRTTIQNVLLRYSTAITSSAKPSDFNERIVAIGSAFATVWRNL